MLRSPSTSSRLHARRGQRLFMEVHDMIHAVTCRRVSQMPPRSHIERANRRVFHKPANLPQPSEVFALFERRPRTPVRLNRSAAASD